MGKYFKEDNNKRVSQVAANVDVDSLAKRIIVSQGSVVRWPWTPKPRTVLKPGQMDPGTVGYQLGSDFVRLEDTGKAAKIYSGAKIMEQSGFGKLVSAILGAKAPLVRQFLDLKIGNAGKRDRDLSSFLAQTRINGQSIDDILNKPYQLVRSGTTKSTSFQLREIVLNFDPTSGKMGNVDYDFTPRQIDDIAKDLRAITKEADTYARIRAGLGTAGVAGAGLGVKALIEKNKAENKAKPETQAVEKQLQNIANPQTNYNFNNDPVGKKKGQ